MLATQILQVQSTGLSSFFLRAQPCRKVAWQMQTSNLQITHHLKPPKIKRNKIIIVNPFAPGNFAKKRVLKLVEWFSGHCRAIKG